MITLCDLSRAFECIPHDCLRFRLEHYKVLGEKHKLKRLCLESKPLSVISTYLHSALLYGLLICDGSAHSERCSLLKNA